MTYNYYWESWGCQNHDAEATIRLSSLAFHHSTAIEFRQYFAFECSAICCFITIIFTAELFQYDFYSLMLLCFLAIVIWSSFHQDDTIIVLYLWLHFHTRYYSIFTFAAHTTSFHIHLPKFSEHFVGFISFTREPISLSLCRYYKIHIII
jgi:hypothetical protein